MTQSTAVPATASPADTTATTAVVVGASSGLGRALATELARRGHALLLVASDRRDVDALAADLHLRHGIAARGLALDLARSADPGAAIIAALDGLPPVAAVLVPAGWSRHDDDGTLDTAAIGPLLAINLHAPLAIAHALLPRLQERRGALVLFGSVAAERGRGRNIVYAAAKRGLVSFAESLRHRHADGTLRVQLYQLGFLRSNLTHGLRLPLPLAEPAEIARDVVQGLGSRSGTYYRPRWWRLVALVVRSLPWVVFRRMKD